MAEKIEFPPELRARLIQLGQSMGLFLEGNLVKLIDPSGDDAFGEYLKSALARDMTIRTKRLKITKQIQEQNKSLTALNDQLISTISELEKARDQAEEALRVANRNNEGIIQFSWMLSHNLRGPIASLLGIINLLEKDRTASPAVSTMVGLLRETSDKIDFKIKEISEVLETHILTPDPPESFLLDEMVTHVFNSSRDETADQSVEFFSEIPEDTSINFPVSSMKKILRAIFENALKFRRDDVCHQVRVSFSEDRYEHRITISDNGTGIEPQHHARIFEPFKVFSEKSTGRGMGLYIAKSLVETANGRIEVNSAPGVGTAITLAVPVVH